MTMSSCIDLLFKFEKSSYNKVVIHPQSYICFNFVPSKSGSSVKQSRVDFLIVQSNDIFYSLHNMVDYVFFILAISRKCR